MRAASETDKYCGENSFTLRNAQLLDDLNLDSDADSDLHTPPPLDISQNISLPMTRESVQTTEETDWSSASAPPSEVTGQYLLSVENTDASIIPVRAYTSPPDILQKCVVRCLYDEDPGPSRAPTTVAPPTVAPTTELDTDHSYTLPGDGIETEPHYDTSMEPALDSQWKAWKSDEAPAAQAVVGCVVENIKGCSAFSELQSLYHIRAAGKFSFTASVKGKLVEFSSILDLN